MASTRSERPGVLVVDDSPFIRRVVADVVQDGARFRVVGEAGDGAEAVRLVHALSPAVVTLDLEMPGLGGLEALGYIMSECPRPVVVLTGRDNPEGEDLALRALELGAVDFVRKPSSQNALDLETLRRRLTQALQAAVTGRADPPRRAPARPWRKMATPAPLRSVSPRPPHRVVVVAASTGGPRTLTELLPQLAPTPHIAWIIVQHMPATFTESFARRLGELATMPVLSASPGTTVHGGHIYLAPGGAHVVVGGDAGDVHFDVHHGPPVHGVRPAADVLLASVVARFGDRVLALVLTGMGRDGAAGAQATHRAGGRVVVQHPESCVVGGMPQATMQLLRPDYIAAPDALPALLSALCASSPEGHEGTSWPAVSA